MQSNTVDYDPEVAEHPVRDKVIKTTSKFYRKIGLDKLVRLAEHVFGTLDDRTRWAVETYYTLGTMQLGGTALVDKLVDSPDYNFIFLTSYLCSAAYYFVGVGTHLQEGKRRAHTN